MNPARASYNDIAGRPWAGSPGLLARLEPFIGNSMSAGWTYPVGEFQGEVSFRHGPGSMLTREQATACPYRDGEELAYVVYSYRTAIAFYTPETGEPWVSDNHWGQTTGRHLGYCRRSLPRIRSNDPSALDGIGPGSRVSYPSGPVACADRGYPALGRVAETYPLAERVVIEPDTPSFDGQRIVKDRAEVALA